MKNMKFQLFIGNRQVWQRAGSVGLAIGLAALLAWPVAAQDIYLAKGRPDGVALLPPPPALGSEEEAADLATVRAVFKARTPAETARAEKDSTLSLFNFAVVIGPEFKPGKFPKMEGAVCEGEDEHHGQHQFPKELLQAAAAIPGGHEPERSARRSRARVIRAGIRARGTVQALMLAELFPEKREAILEFGREIGWDRVLIGKHFPTDVQAGRVMGRAIMRELMASAAFQHDLAEAKAEVRGRAGGENPVKK